MLDDYYLVKFAVFPCEVRFYTVVAQPIVIHVHLKRYHCVSHWSFSQTIRSSFRYEQFRCFIWLFDSAAFIQLFQLNLMWSVFFLSSIFSSSIISHNQMQLSVFILMLNAVLWQYEKNKLLEFCIWTAASKKKNLV